MKAVINFFAGVCSAVLILFALDPGEMHVWCLQVVWRCRAFVRYLQDWWDPEEVRQRRRDSELALKRFHLSAKRVTHRGPEVIMYRFRREPEVSDLERALVAAGWAVERSAAETDRL